MKRSSECKSPGRGDRNFGHSRGDSLSPLPGLVSLNPLYLTAAAVGHSLPPLTGLGRTMEFQIRLASF